MRTFLISYDLAITDARHRLANEIMQLGDAWARPLACTWFVRTTERCSAVEGRLRPLLAADDGLLIQEVESETALVNTNLRWFKRRRTEAGTNMSNIISFPSEMSNPVSQSKAA
jgi:hypothetical protein